MRLPIRRYRIEGRLALVTGAARGLGRAIVRELVGRGARVVAVDVAVEALEALPADLGVGTDRCRTARLDVTDPAAIATFRDQLRRREGGIEILVNNAGVVYGGPFVEVPLERHLRTIAVNLEGPIAMTHAFLADLCAADAGRLVNIASASGFLGLPWGVTYSASKWGMVGFSEGIRQELAASGRPRVRVTAVCPAYIETELFRGARPPRGTRALEPPYVARRAIDAMCRGRRRLLLPLLARAAPWTVVLPSWIADPLSRVLGVADSMRGWRGRRGESPTGRSRPTSGQGAD